MGVGIIKLKMIKDIHMEHVVVFLVVTNAVLGILLLEWAWNQLRNVSKTQNDERDQKFPAYYRRDVKQWRKWNMQIGASTFLLVRLGSFIGAGLVSAILLSIVNIFHKHGEKVGKIKQIINRAIISMAGIVFLVSTLTTYKKTLVSCDYSLYLGKNYEKPAKYSTIISNHFSFMDPVCGWFMLLGCSYAGADVFKHAPIISQMCNAVETLWLPRGGSKDSKDKVIAEMN